MHTLVRVFLVLAIILQVGLISGTRSKRAAVSRRNQIIQLVAAAKKFLNDTATQEQLTQMRRDVAVCFKKNLTAVASLIQNNLASFLNPFLGGRRKREVNSAQESQPVPDKIDLSKESQIRAQVISAIMTQVKKLLNTVPIDQLVAGRKFVQSLSTNDWLSRGLFLTAGLTAVSLCANTDFITG